MVNQSALEEKRNLGVTRADCPIICNPGERLATENGLGAILANAQNRLQGVVIPAARFAWQ